MDDLQKEGENLQEQENNQNNGPVQIQRSEPSEKIDPLNESQEPPQSPATQSGNEKNPDKKSMFWLWFLIIGIVLILIVGSLIFLLINQEDKTENQNTGAEIIEIKNLSHAQTKQKILHANSNISDYNIELDTYTYFYMVFLGQSIETEMNYSLKGGIDRENQEMSLKGDMIVSAMENQTKTDFEMILKDKKSQITSNGTTNTTQLTDQEWEQIWDQYDSIGQSYNYFENSEFQFLQDERVDGVDCYVINISVNKERLLEESMQQSEQVTMTDEQKQQYIQMIKGYLSKIWVDKKTLKIKKGINYINLDSEGFGMIVKMDYIISENN
jgi:hypothetical protein